MVSHQQQIYLNDSTRGIFVFDVYGKYKKRIPIKGLSHFQLQGSYLVYFKSPHLIRYHTKTLEKDTISLPAVKNIEDVQIQQERMYILRNNRLSLFER